MLSLNDIQPEVLFSFQRWALGREEFQGFVFIDNHGILNNVSELSDVSGPGVLLQLSDTFLRNFLDGLAHGFLKFLGKGPNQQGNVFTSIPKGGEP